MSGSDFVQLISLPMEVVGFTLTIVESFSETKKQNVEMKLSTTLQKLKGFFNQHKLLSIATTLSFYAILTLAVIQRGMDNPKYISRSLAEGLFVTCAMIIFAIGIFSTIAKIFPKRKLLALGLTLSAAGIFGEIYQVSKISIF